LAVKVAFVDNIECVVLFG